MKNKLNPASRRFDEMRKVIQFPSWLETRKNFQIERLLEYVLKIKNQELIKRAIILSENSQMPEVWYAKQSGTEKNNGDEERGEQQRENPQREKRGTQKSIQGLL